MLTPQCRGAGQINALHTVVPAYVDDSSSINPWIAFGGTVLVIGVLYWAQTVVVPLALATLLSFVLATPVTWLERWVGRVPAVLAIVTVLFLVMGLAGWGLMRQLDHLADELPAYRGNIRQKIDDVRGAGKGGTVEKLQETIEEIKTDLGKDDPAKGTPAKAPESVVVTPTPPAGFPGYAWLGPFIGPLGTAGFVLALVIFMLLERRDLRNRLIGLIGHGRLTATTKAFDEAGTRVSKQLLMQSLVNAIYGIAAGVGLYFLGVPYALLWGTLGAALRFIPYLGPLLGAGAPILISLAALPGWAQPLWVVAMFVVLELFTNLVLETVLYAGAAGVSQVALLISVAFWTWLWGPLGLLMATPLTVCLVVLGKHVPGLTFVGTLMADTPPLAPEYGYYQRLLARDPAEAADLIDQHIKTESAKTVYDSLLLPALNYAERDRLEERLSPDEEAAVIESTRELLTYVGDSARRAQAAVAVDEEAPEIPVSEIGREPLRVLGYAVNAGSDELALAMLAQAVSDLPIVIESTSTRLLASDLIALVRTQGVSVICLADLPPSPPSKTRYLVKRLRAAMPDLRIVVGRWSPAALADESTVPLKDAGATLVATTLVETSEYLEGLLEIVRMPAGGPKSAPPSDTGETTTSSEPTKSLTAYA
jgi:predicted PurR-regulated permease PerM